MKCIYVAAVSLALFHFAQAIPENILREIEGCKNKTNVPDSDLELIMQKKMPETKNGKCMMACIMKALDMMTEDGHFNPEGMKAMTADDEHIDKADIPKLEKIADECAAEVKGDDECENAVQISKCTVRKAKEMGIKEPEGL